MMEQARPWQGLLRERGPGKARVLPIELFFDLVYVFAITQLSHLLLSHLTPHGVFQTVLLEVAVWIAWVYTAWFTNWFDPNRRVIRGVVIAVMVASLIMSASLPEAFGERGLLFASTYVAGQVLRVAFSVLAFAGYPAQRRNFQRILFWVFLSGFFWIAGGLASGAARESLWVAAVAVDVIAPALSFYTPGLGKSSTQDWNIAGEHLAERCELFLIIALGESVLVTGATFGEMEISTPVLAAFVLAFLGSVALWWVYFDRSAGAAEAVIAASADPGRLGRSAYTYYHLPMVAGIIVAAVGDELVIAEPLGHTTPAMFATILGGPALYLAGHALFKFSVFGMISQPRITGIALLALVAGIGQTWSPVAVSAAALLVIVGIGYWDTRLSHPMPIGVTIDE
jgi:low temperature requirement protein LtrA